MAQQTPTGPSRNVAAPTFTPGGEAPSTTPPGPRVGGAEPAGPREGGAAPSSVGAGTTVQSIRSTSSGARGSGAEGFDPSKGRPIEWQDLPEKGEKLTYDASAGAVPVMELVDAISLATGWNIVTSQQLEEQRVRLWVNNVTPAELLRILRFYGVYAEYDRDINLLTVMTVEEHVQSRYGAIEKAVFNIEYAEVVDMEAILTSLMSENGKMLIDPRTATIVIWDTPDNLAEMQATLDRLDVPMQRVVYELNHIDAENVLDSVGELLSEIGLAQLDPRSNKVIVQDLPSRQEQIAELISVLDKPVNTRTWTLNYMEPDDMLDRLGTVVPSTMEPVSTDEITHQLSITAAPDRLEEIDKLIKEWDVSPSQVQIEAYLVTVSTSITRNFGINWHYFDEKAGTSFAIRSGSSVPDYSSAPGTGSSVNIGTLPYQVPLYDWWTGNPITDAAGDAILDPEFKGNRISAVLEFLDNEGEAQILSRPKVTVSDGEEAVFQNTRDEPYQSGGYRTYGETTSSSTGYNSVIPLNVQFITVGTVLRVMPKISEDGNITMEVSAEQSDAEQATVTVGDQQSTIPSKTQSSTETKVMVHNQQTLVIGGLRSASFDDSNNRVPILGEVPLLGRLFKSTNNSADEQEFLIFITPTIVDEYTRPEADRIAEIDSSIADTQRLWYKPILARLKDKVTQGGLEIDVSIGSNGAVYSEGERFSVEGLAELFPQIENPTLKTVVIRQHINAPPAVGEEIAALAEAANLHVEFVELANPAVPDPRPEWAPPLAPLEELEGEMTPDEEPAS